MLRPIRRRDEDVSLEFVSVFEFVSVLEFMSVLEFVSELEFLSVFEFVSVTDVAQTSIGAIRPSRAHPPSPPS